MPDNDKAWVVGEGADQHYAAIGRFIAAFSSVEISLHVCFRNILNVGDSTARALIEEPMVSKMLESMAKVIDTLSLPDEYVEVFDYVKLHLKALLDIRGIVAHKPFYHCGQSMKFYDSFTVKNIAKTYEYVVTVDQLIAASKEVELINAIIGRYLLTLQPHAEMKRMLDAHIQAAFQQTPDLPPHKSQPLRPHLRPRFPLSFPSAA